MVRLAVRGFVGSQCNSLFVGSRCDDLRFDDRGFFRFNVHGFDDLAGGATILGFLGSRSLSLSLCLRMWVLSLSLSLFARLRKWFEGKILAENIFRVKGLNFTVNWNSFPENPFSMRNQTPAFTKKHFWKWFEAKTNTALAISIFNYTQSACASSFFAQHSTFFFITSLPPLADRVPPTMPLIGDPY